ncbi:MAG: hypothetical protein Q9199_001226, partial [Rusavskia elegans]
MEVVILIRSASNVAMSRATRDTVGDRGYCEVVRLADTYLGPPATLLRRVRKQGYTYKLPPVPATSSFLSVTILNLNFAYLPPTQVSSSTAHTITTTINDKMVKPQRKVQKPAENSPSTAENPEESGVSKETCVLEAKPLATSQTAEGVDNTETELVELHLPDETSTFEKILAKIQQPSHDEDVVGAPPEATDYTGHLHTTEEVVRDTLNKVGNGVVYVRRIGYKVKEIDYPQHAKSALRWSAAHPYQTALQVGMGVLMEVASPPVGLTQSPAATNLLILLAGSAAAARHAVYRTISSPSTFAMLQSAGAGGYGAPIIHGLVRAGSVAASGLGVITTTFGKGELPTSEGTLSADSIDLEEHGSSKQRLEGEGPSDETKSAEEAKEQDSILQRTFGKSKLVRSESELSSLLQLSTTNKTPLITLWTASWCSSCRTIRPFLADLIERDALGEIHGGVAYAEVEMDSPDIGALA